jgi:hypothetical protein
LPNTVQNKKHFGFVGGLNTEASPLTFPPNTWADGDNCVPEVDGSINLRTAIDYEPSASLSSSSFTSTQETNGAWVVAEWNNVGGNGNRNFLVVQQDSTITFYVNSGTTISSQTKSFSISLTSYKAASNTEVSGVAPITCANANGKLIITSRDTEPLLVEYDATGDTISVSTIDLKFRDFIGVDDDLIIDERPLTLSKAHEYNLLNQGWNSTNITTYFTGAAKYPSNAQSWTSGKDSSDNFTQAQLDKQDFGTSPAPKGRFILNLFNRDRSTASGVSGLTADTEAYRPTACAFFAGRVWYAGIKSASIGTWVMFSQVAETSDNLGKCYQDADPTSEVVSDLVASDGGVIPIQDAGQILKLLPFLDSLLVIADNGVWQIVGGSNAGFAADAYEVKRLSAFGAISAKSVVVTDIGVFYWGEDAIYGIGTSQVGDVQVQPITPGVIQTLYTDIPATGKIYSSGVYVPDERIIYWLYSDDDAQDGISYRFKKNRVLCFNTRIKAFYTMTIGTLASLSPYVCDLFVTKTRSTSSITATVVDSSVSTVVVGTDTVVATLSPDVVATPIGLKFYTVVPQSATSVKVTFSNFNETDDAPIKWRDWYTNNTAGITYSGYVVPGYDFGEGQGADRRFQSLYVTVFMRRTETGIDGNGNPINPSSCTLQGRWDFSDSAASNKWSTSQEAYRHKRVFLGALSSGTYDDGYNVVVTKNKVRGRGRALQLKFTSSADKDMQILGWAITYVGNANV